MDYPLVSVIIACYNHGKFLSESIESALNQSYKNIEIIVVNDGSTDNTNLIMNAYRDRIHSINLKKNKGVGNARNIGLSASMGTYIALLDADDVMLYDKIESQMNALQREDADYVLCRYQYFLDTGKERKNLEEVSYPWPQDDIIISSIINGFTAGVPLFRKDVLVNVNGFSDLTPLDDAELHFRLAIHGFRIAYVDRVLYKLQLHNEGRLTDNRMLHFETALKLANYYSKELGRNNLWNSRRRETVADYSYQCGRFLYRNNRKEDANQAFYFAKKIYPSFQPKSGGIAYRSLARVFGLRGAEFIRLVAKRLLRKSVA